MNYLPWILVGGGLGLLGYVLVGYPAVLAVLARCRPRPVQRDAGYQPSVSLLISAYNETRDLPAKLASLWQLDYPPDRLEVLVADDGSADGTGELAERLAASPEAAGRLRLLERTGNLGKPAQLNRLAAAASGDLLIFTDARQPLCPDAVANLASYFADPAVGGVTGAVEYRTADGQPATIGAYWRYESMLRAWEGTIASCCGAAGPLLAMRRELFSPLPENVVLDDVLGPMRLVMQGHRFTYAPDAIAVETYGMAPRHELDRRIRTLAGNYQLLRFEPRLLLPGANPIWWQFVSHKVGRLLVPWLLAAALAGALLGYHRSPWAAGLLWLQAAGYAYAAVGGLANRLRWAPPGSRLAYSLLLLAAAALLGLVRDLRGGTQARWGAQERHRRG